MFGILARARRASPGHWLSSGPRDYDADRFLTRPGTRRHFYTSGDDVLPPPGCIEGLGRTAQKGYLPRCPASGRPPGVLLRCPIS